MFKQVDFDSLHNVTGGKHFYQFYKQVEDYLRVLIPYFQMGLEKGDACLWLVSQKMGMSEIQSIIEGFIPDLSIHLDSGQFHIVCAEDWYLNRGRFSEKQALTYAEHFIKDIKSNSFNRLRAAGDMGSIPREDWDKVHAYEAKISPKIRSADAIALCSYPILECTLTETKAILESHDDVLVSHI